jgi:hypothetical protein
MLVVTRGREKNFFLKLLVIKIIFTLNLCFLINQRMLLTDAFKFVSN